MINSPGPDDLSDRKRQRMQAHAICDFLHSFLLSALFIWMFTLHESLAKISHVENAMLFELRDKPFDDRERTIEDVHDTKLFWNWLENGLLPTVINQRDQVGNILPESEWSFLGEFNKIIGGIRLVQTRTLQQDCDHQLALQFYRHCYPEKTRDSQSFGLPECRMSATSRSGTCYNASEYTGTVDTIHNEGFMKDSIYDHFEMWLDLSEPESVLRGRIHYLESRHWVDKQTMTIVVEILLFNNQYEPLICDARLLLTLERSGYITVRAPLETVPVEPYASDFVMKVTLECVYILLMAEVTFRRGWRLLRDVHDHGLAWCRPPWHFAHVIDCINILLGLVLVCSWAVFVNTCNSFTDTMNSLHRPDAVPLHDGTDYQIWGDFHHAIANLEDKCHTIITQLTIIRDVASLTLFALILRFFKTWKGIPEMAVISKTSTVAFSHLSSLLVAIFVLVFMWAGAGMILFGHQIHDFTYLLTALGRTFEIVLVADQGQLKEMHEIAPIFGTIWHWSLMVIMYIVVLNIVLAVLVHSFEETADDSDKTSLLRQAASTCRYYYRKVLSRCPKLQSRLTNTSVAAAMDAESGQLGAHAGESDADAHDLPADNSTAQEVQHDLIKILPRLLQAEEAIRDDIRRLQGQLQEQDLHFREEIERSILAQDSHARLQSLRGIRV